MKFKMGDRVELKTTARKGVVRGLEGHQQRILIKFDDGDLAWYEPDLFKLEVK